MNATMSRQTPQQDRIAKLFIDMITEKGRELASLPPAEMSSPYDRDRRALLVLAIDTLRRDLRRHVRAMRPA